MEKSCSLTRLFPNWGTELPTDDVPVTGQGRICIQILRLLHPLNFLFYIVFYREEREEFPSFFFPTDYPLSFTIFKFYFLPGRPLYNNLYHHIPILPLISRLSSSFSSPVLLSLPFPEHQLVLSEDDWSFHWLSWAVILPVCVFVGSCPVSPRTHHFQDYHLSNA